MGPQQPHTFGELLKHYRGAAGLTQEALAERAQISVRGVSDLEHGRTRTPRPDTLALLVTALGAAPKPGDSAAPQPQPEPQAMDAGYTAKIREYTTEPFFLTELVDHLPASDTVPSPLKFLGRAVGMPGELTYAKDIYRYYEALARAAPTRARYWKVGTTEEGRDIVLLAIADEATIKSLDKYRDMLGELTEDRKSVV